LPNSLIGSKILVMPLVFKDGGSTLKMAYSRSVATIEVTNKVNKLIVFFLSSYKEIAFELIGKETERMTNNPYITIQRRHIL
jgi:hypothetical protein